MMKDYGEVSHSREKEGIEEEVRRERPRSNGARWVIFGNFIVLSCIILLSLGFTTTDGSKLPNNLLLRCPWRPKGANGVHDPNTLCPLLRKVDPSDYIYDKDGLNRILHDKEFKQKSLHRLSGAVNIPTEIYDEMLDPGSAASREKLYEKEPRWKPFEQFHDYLKATFPLVHSKLKVDTVNKFALVYTWEGKSDKKPILLAAHMDVVPVQKETIGQWTYPPFNATFDGKYLFGRGVSDCKNLLIGLLETLEVLLEEGKFSPERTIILGFGYDEEAEGAGAGHIYNHLVEKYGQDSMYAVIDEGNEGFTTIEGTKFILPATGEKGYVDSVIDITTKGGHSSVPPKHTLIGILAKLIDLIEEDPFEPILTPANPVLKQLQCVAEHSPSIDKSLKRNILLAHLNQKSNKAVLEYLTNDTTTKFLVTTSQAVDIVNGGTKSNALPEFATVLVNHRISIEHTVESTTKHILGHVKSIAERFNLGIIFNGETIKPPSDLGYFNYSLVQPLQPAPNTPTTGETWEKFGGSLRFLYEELIFPNANDTYVVSPFINSGNTDTKNYWGLTRNIYRYSPGLSSSGIHSVDEKLEFEGHFHIVAFYYYYLQLIDKLKDVED